jgi:hypothetical protein
MRNKRLGMLLGGLLLVVLGGLLLPRLNAAYVAAGHRQSAAGDHPQAQAGVPAQPAPAAGAAASGSASASSEPASSSASVSTVVPPAAAGQSEATAPSLQILSPKAGDDVSAPFTVRFLISGIDSATLAKLNIRMTIGNPPFYSTTLPIDGPQGSATVPDDKMLSGRRDLVFSLARADGSPLAASPSSVLVAGVTISGRR